LSKLEEKYKNPAEKCTFLSPMTHSCWVDLSNTHYRGNLGDNAYLSQLFPSNLDDFSIAELPQASTSRPDDIPLSLLFGELQKSRTLPFTHWEKTGMS
jgi:hypothetical protein